MREGTWLRPSKITSTIDDTITIQTEPKTDLWQRTYYGFRVANAPMFLWRDSSNFAFSFKCRFPYSVLYDQCGVVLYLDDENWFKASIEYENSDFSRLGSVVTNHGQSDWATTDITTPGELWYRLSRRGPDFLVESSKDGNRYQQMRVFHMYHLGETTAKMGSRQPSEIPCGEIQFGVYACSPTGGSFLAEFSNFHFGPSQWQAETP